MLQGRVPDTRRVLVRLLDNSARLLERNLADNPPTSTNHNASVFHRFVKRLPNRTQVKFGLNIYSRSQVLELASVTENPAQLLLDDMVRLGRDSGRLARCHRR